MQKAKRKTQKNMLRRAVTRSAGTRIHRKTDAAADNCGSVMLFPGIYNSFELFSRIGGRRYRLSFPARDPGVRRFIRRMRPKAEPEGRWDGSAGEDVPRGHTLCYNPQRRYVRREDQTAEPFVPYRFADRQICRGARSQASAQWADRRRRKRGGSVVSKGVQGTAVPCTTIANLTERAKRADRRGDASPPCELI